ncbi:MAG: hypothetical protein Athens071426_542 [Parcubacteria group bacterium Athens0714_26]|nr:MAG: hypothetical protein Athens101426_33 [Parcubacteria group bacterium Athens1014_26]TSD02204.1 MAG: hypothetical protein Athens071426_542 [Parcubacteria group bacterium Athens0714_26]
MINKKILILSVLFIALFATVASGIYFVFSKKSDSRQDKNQNQVTRKESPHKECLEENEMVDYDRISLNPAITQPKESSPTIFVKNKSTGKVIKSFQIENVRDSGYPIEIHKCGVYFIQEFNYNPQKTIQEVGYREELWKYDYAGQKKC